MHWEGQHEGLCVSGKLAFERKEDYIYIHGKWLLYSKEHFLSTSSWTSNYQIKPKVMFSLSGVQPLVKVKFRMYEWKDDCPFSTNFSKASKPTLDYRIVLPPSTPYTS